MRISKAVWLLSAGLLLVASVPLQGIFTSMLGGGDSGNLAYSLFVILAAIVVILLCANGIRKGESSVWIYYASIALSFVAFVLTMPLMMLSLMGTLSGGM